MANGINISKLVNIILLTFLDSFPYMVLALYTFRGHWRFKKNISISLLCAVAILQMILVPFNSYFGNRDNPYFDIFLSIIQIIFFFAAVKTSVGKLIFTVLVITNLGTMVVAWAECLVNIVFPNHSQYKFDFTYILFTILMLIFLIPVMYMYIFKYISSPSEIEDNSASESEYMWNYLWIIPAIFYLIWVYHLYSGNKYHVDLSNVIFLSLINAGSLIIYRTIIQTVQLYKKNTALLAENHVLSIQQLQYDSLNERLENMRRTRHDLRHYTSLLKEIKESGDISELDNLINMFTKQNMLNQQLIYCENEVVNVVLALYTETAYENNISLSVKTNIPKDVFIDKKDLSVLFGNILENASDACKELEEDRFINLTAIYNSTDKAPHSLSIIVKNNYATEPSHTESGIFHSTKHSGDGIGISSVRNITEKYDGASTFTHENGIFTVSMILYEKKSKQYG
ncbi:MAG: ATP-binding protein [Eubacterium sp.]|nr:ATP-binding protein [Eubacterium sp.]